MKRATLQNNSNLLFFFHTINVHFEKEIARKWRLRIYIASLRDSISASWGMVGGEHQANRFRRLLETLFWKSSVLYKILLKNLMPLKYKQNQPFLAE